MAESRQRGRVLVVDDDGALGTVLVALIQQAGAHAQHVASGEEALASLASGGFDAVLSDLRMDGMDGLELLRAVRTTYGELPVVMLTAHGNVETAVAAMKAGANDFLTKPFDREEVVFAVKKALLQSAAHDARPAAAPALEAPVAGQSEAMRAVQELIERAARASSTVLLRGESGTGKEVAARAIHDHSPRAEGPFVAVHCAALPDHLLESELFGYEKGAFTGATQRKPGRVELADGGTVFLDEMGDVSPAVQVKLLRLLQEKVYQPLGAIKERRANVRFVAATHRNLEEMVEHGEFREDLYYRLDVLPIWLPPLRERLADVEALAHQFCARVARDNGRAGVVLSAEAIAALGGYDWPGNVRELANFVERLVIFSDADTITVTDVERELGRRGTRSRSSRAPDSGDLAGHRAEAEHQAIRNALDRSGGNRTRAARLLGISRRTLYNRLADMGL
jgi:two-component system, NtrC family, response regulator AtoC